MGWGGKGTSREEKGGREKREGERRGRKGSEYNVAQ